MMHEGWTSPPEGVRAIFFDLDNTLVDHGGAARGALRLVRERYAPLFGALPFEGMHAAWSAINEELWVEYGAGRITSRQLQTSRAQRLIDWAAERSGVPEAGLPPADEVSVLHIGHYLDASAPYDGVVAMLENLRDRYTLGIVTNSFTARPKLAKAGIARYFAHLIESEEIGVQKPDPAIFHAALAAAGVAAGEALYIGDDLTCDVHGAASAGLATIWFNPQGRELPADPLLPRPAAVAGSIAELSTFLGASLEVSPAS